MWLSLIKGLGSKKKQLLIEVFKKPEIIYKSNRGDLLKVKGIGEETIKSILNEKVRKDLKRHIEYITNNNIEIITIEDEQYPNKLKEIYDPPMILYARGNIDILNKESIAIVGCRDISNYGISATKYFSFNLARKNINIISGLAKGVDSFAHIGAICAKGKTIAVVGNGLDSIYPRENLDIAKKILETGGTILSEYPLGTKPEKKNFPARNRIISGLSTSIIVVEAKERSGTLITVDFALEQGRNVYVVPGNIDSINSVGTNELLKQGAKPITSYLDLKEDFGSCF